MAYTPIRLNGGTSRTNLYARIGDYPKMHMNRGMGQRCMKGYTADYHSGRRESSRPRDPPVLLGTAES